MKKISFISTAIFLFLFVVFSIYCCKKSDENGVSDIQVQQVLDIANNQQVYYDSLMMYIGLTDTADAISRTLQLLKSDTAVSKTVSSSYGIQILYSNGMRGGILLDPGDHPEFDTTDFQKLLNNRKSRGEPGIKTVPHQKKTIFLNPHYHERKIKADGLIMLFNEWFPDAGYEQPETYLAEEATVERFAFLSDIGYGIIHIYSHGMPWYDDNGSIETVYLMTGEEISFETIKRWYYEIIDGDIPMIHIADNCLYFISPEFFSHYNDFVEEAPLIWGGFCFSERGDWPDHFVNTSRAGGYFCFDWSVYSIWNVAWAVAAFQALTDINHQPPYSVGTWLANSPEIPKSYINKNLWQVHMMYYGDNTLSLIPGPPGVDVYNYLNWKINISLNLDWVNSEGTNEDLSSFQTNIKGNLPFNNSGTFLGITYTSVWDTISAINVGLRYDTIRDKGELIVNFDETYETVTSLTLERSVRYIVKHGDKPDSMYFHWGVVTLPIANDQQNFKIYSIGGKETFNNWTFVERSNWWDDGKWEKINSFNCDGTPSGTSGINIEFHNFNN